MTTSNIILRKMFKKKTIHLSWFNVKFLTRGNIQKYIKAHKKHVNLCKKHLKLQK